MANCNHRPKDADFIFINGSEPQSLDPAIVTGQIEIRLCNALFEGLTTRDACGVAQPAMAKSWEISPDGLVYTFHLRENIRWSNGDAITAYDFEKSWKRVLEPETASRYAEIMYFIKNAEAYNKDALKDFSQVGIRALDERTLQVKLHSPAAFFPDVVAFTTYLPVHIPTIEKYGDRWTHPQNIVSNGAYVLRAWKINDRVELEKNPFYWRKDSVAFNRVHALAVSKANTAFNLYSTGQADLILDKGMVPAVLIQELRKQADFHANPFLATYFYRFNVTRAPFNDIRVRKAFALAIDKQRIVEKITKAGEPIAPSFTPPGIPGYTPPDGLAYNPSLAKKLFTDAGFAEGKNFPRVSLLYNKTDLNEQIAVEIQAMWQEILGVTIELRNQEWATYLNALNHLDFDIARSSWVGDYNDPNTFLDCFLTGRGNNRTGWSHAQYDSLMKQAASTLDAKRRFELLQQAEKILVEQELPIVPLYFFVGINLYNAQKLDGIHPNVVDEHPLREMRWK
ncbi:MAG: peptide ABC transporter substrate-binding protein [Verrucomicrobiota bacterium]